jgi:homeobox-leucine zipper protein
VYALGAMDELIQMAKPDSDLWIKSSESGKEEFNHDSMKGFNSPSNTPKPNCFVAEATRETVLLCINAAALIETFMDAVCHIIFLILYEV